MSDQSVTVISALGEDIRNAVHQFVSIGIGLIEMAIIFVCASLVVRAIRRPVRGRLAATLVPDNAKRIVENAVTFGVYALAATLLLTFWGVTWSTQYNATEGKFESQQISLSRDLHEWRAAFNFTKAPNGNFQFFFSVFLTDFTDIKFDYNQTTIRP